MFAYYMSGNTTYTRMEQIHFLAGMGAQVPYREMPLGGARLCMGKGNEFFGLRRGIAQFRARHPLAVEVTVEAKCWHGYVCNPLSRGTWPVT